ncbi:hypothetical protein TorRG33x02_305620, partial [Trema orientale]
QTHMKLSSKLNGMKPNSFLKYLAARLLYVKLVPTFLEKRGSNTFFNDAHIARAINVAALVADEGLHGAKTLGAIHRLWELSGHARNIKPAAVVDRLNNLAIILLENQFKSLFLHYLLPLLQLLHNFYDGQTMASYNHG